jgi:dipeptidyl aminopeptidase/acylaminoacyl peptidase
MRAILVGLFGLAAAYGGSVSAAPLEAYGRLPQYENVALSSDGEKAAFVTTIGDKREVIVQPLATNNGVIRLRAGDQKLRDVSWAGTEQLLITVSQAKGYLGGEQSESFALQNFDLKRKSAFSPMTWTTEARNMLAAEPVSRVINGKAVVYIQSFTSPPLGKSFAIPALYKSNLQDQTTQLINGAPGSNPREAYRWMVDSKGYEILQSVYDEDAKSWSLFTRKGDNWNKVYAESALIDTPQLIGLYQDDSKVLIRKREDGEWLLRVFSISDGKFGEVLPDHCCGAHYLSDPKSSFVIGYSWQDARRHYLFFDSALQQQWDQVVQSFPGEEVTLESWSADEKKIIVLVFGSNTGAAYFLIDMTSKQMSRVGDLYAGIVAADVATVKPVVYDAADGFHVPGYLTLPSGKAPKNLPLIVMPHGGPAARDSLRFDWFAQALASRGYLVLQANFRGSWGAGVKLEEAGYGEYGRKMQTDVADGVRALVKLGIVDPQRVCIVGASYGGYVALLGATTESDIYRCAVSIAGVSDLKTNLGKYKNVSISPDSRGLRYMMRYTGAHDLDDPVLTARSPVTHADGVKGPLLLIHGEDDAVVSIEQSQVMAAALKKANKPYEFVKLKSEDHWLSKADTRLQMLQAVVKFLETNNPP